MGWEGQRDSQLEHGGSEGTKPGVLSPSSHVGGGKELELQAGWVSFLCPLSVHLRLRGKERGRGAKSQQKTMGT